MDGIAAVADAPLPVLHEVSQRDHGVIDDGDFVLRRPGFHGDQDDAGVQLLFVDLGEIMRENNR